MPAERRNGFVSPFSLGSDSFAAVARAITNSLGFSQASLQEFFKPSRVRLTMKEEAGVRPARESDPAKQEPKAGWPAHRLLHAERIKSGKPFRTGFPPLCNHL
jgi:hypothetical protein